MTWGFRPGACYQAPIRWSSQAEPAMLAIISTSLGGITESNLLLLVEVWTLLVRPNLPQVSRDRFYRAAQALQSPRTSSTAAYTCRDLKDWPATLQQLKALGAVARNVGGSCSVKAVSTAFLRALLARLGVDSTAATALAAQVDAATATQAQERVVAAVQQQQQQAPPPPPPAEQRQRQQQQPHQPPPPQPPQQQQQQPSWTGFPTQLPTISAATYLQMGKRYGLSLKCQGSKLYLAPDTPLRAQLEGYRAWCMAEGVMTRPFTQMQDHAAKNAIDRLLQFFGFVHRRHKVALSRLQLSMAGSPSYVAEHLALMAQRKLSKGTLQHSLDEIRRVAQYQAALIHEEQAAKGGSTSAAAEQQQQALQRLAELEAWLSGPLRRVLGEVGVKRKLVDITTKPSLATLVQAQEALVKSKVAAFQQAAAAEQGQPGSLKLEHVLGLQEAATLSLCFGHTSPPRISCLISVKAPVDANTPCTKHGCKLPDCKGNRLQLLPSGALQMELPHHKNTSKNEMHSDPIVFELPKELQQLLKPWLQQGRPWLLRYMADQGTIDASCRAFDQRPLTLLINHRKGRAFTFNEFNVLFKQLLQQAGIPQSKSFPPKHLRHIFVSELTDGVGAHRPEAELQGMATLMGHSYNQWHKETYHRGLKRSRTSRGVAAMVEVRQLLLAMPPPAPEAAEGQQAAAGSRQQQQQGHSSSTTQQQQQQQPQAQAGAEHQLLPMANTTPAPPAAQRTPPPPAPRAQQQPGTSTAAAAVQASRMQAVWQKLMARPVLQLQQQQPPTLGAAAAPRPARRLPAPGPSLQQPVARPAADAAGNQGSTLAQRLQLLRQQRQQHQQQQPAAAGLARAPAAANGSSGGPPRAFQAMQMQGLLAQGLQQGVAGAPAAPGAVEVIELD